MTSSLKTTEEGQEFPDPNHQFQFSPTLGWTWMVRSSLRSGLTALSRW